MTTAFAAVPGLPAILEAHGTPSQRERFEAGRLPEAELLAVVRAWLFAPMKTCPRYERIYLRDIRHRGSCEADSEGQVACEVEEPYAGVLSHEQWARRDAVVRGAALAVAKAGAAISVVDRLHVCECVVCGAKARALSCLVTLTWQGRAYSREYKL